ncbi:inositol monophosphatase family protein [Enterobacteriaceae endosymbiont of Donacia sparganii]|uniref:inositol monophosphatase family protein n=1 Tax=Enterobacteriaceae endosymbiont of Donacia sparganii TaxID=2675785 RepID=UPI001449E5B7|nr:inositol monophosphatase family protein [Enterobacteriaceae endosymbiont of Donacia sparganii]QJC35698.1 inositol monophosphatase [Enterobacteriaceae endosymbiont of Donacia sparganii]
MRPMLNIAIRLIRNIGNIIIKNYEIQNININHYNYDINIFIKKINQNLINIITKLFYNIYAKNIIFLSKENLFIFKYKKTVWIINPIDGIMNFLKKLPHFSISIAICIKEKTEISLVYDPLKNDLFTAIRGQNAQLNGYKLRCDKYIKQKNLLFALNTNYFFFNKNNINLFNLFKNNLILLRMSGSISLDLVYLAANKIDCYINNNVNNFNYLLAGELIIKESGGLITDFIGNYNYKNSSNILAGNSSIIKLVMSSIKNVL